MLKNNNKIIVILGPTASGKTSLAVKLAYKFNGEIVSADSRQVYRGMDVGTGKDLDEYKLQIPNNKSQITNKSQIPNSKFQKYRTVRIPHHLIDVVSPKTRFSLAKYQKLAFRAIDDILKRGKLPIIVGGTGLYLQAVVDNYNLSNAKLDKKLREKLEKYNVEQLFNKLQKLNSAFADKLHESDKKNKRRLIRYIEIANQREFNRESTRNKKNYEFLLIGLTWQREVLQERIYERLIERLGIRRAPAKSGTHANENNEDMVGEVERLHKEGVSWKRLEGFGLEYKFVSLYLQKKLDYEEMVEKLNIASRQFAKRQMSWFRRWERHGRKIYWVKNINTTNNLIKKFLLSKNYPIK